jgi:hypothetical protein
MTDPRLVEHLETAVRQRVAARRLRLAGIVLASAPLDPVATALVGLSLERLDEAAPFVDRAIALARVPGSLDGLSATLRAVVETARAVHEMARLDPHAACERLSGLVRMDLPDPLAEGVVRLALAASAATGDEDLAHRALERAKGLPGLGRETAWFAYFAAKRMGKPGADGLLEAAEAGTPAVRACLEGAGPMPEAGNPGAFAEAGDDALLAAVLPGLFRVGGLPDRKPVAQAA